VRKHEKPEEKSRSVSPMGSSKVRVLCGPSINIKHRIGVFYVDYLLFECVSTKNPRRNHVVFLRWDTYN